MSAANNVALDKALPSNVDAERFVLGAILMDDAHYISAAGALDPDDFSVEKHRRIFRRMGELSTRGERVDRVTLANELMRYNELELCDGLSYLVSLDDGLPQIFSLDSYIRIVKDKSILRRIIFTSQKLIDRCFIAEEDPDHILSSAEETLLKLGETRARETLLSPRQVIEQVEGGVNVFLDPSKRIKGISTGFSKFDEMTAGLHEGELIILAARPSMGKTALALNVCHHIAANPAGPRRPVAVFSLEMSSESLLTRMVCAAARVDQQKFRAGYLSADERRRLQMATMDLVESPIFIDDTPGVNLMDIHAKLRRVQSEHGLGLVCIDYLQLMSSRGRSENRNQEVSAISRGLKLLSKELRVPFLVLSQLSRAPETRPGDHRPQLSDLRESGCLTGDTLIPIPCTGQRIPIRDLCGQENVKVWALNEQALKLERATASRVFPTGVKPVFLLRTRLGRVIRATSNHPFRTFREWKPLSGILPGEHIALPRIVPSAARQTMSVPELALLGHLIGDGCTLPRHAIQYTTRELDLAELVADLCTQVFGDEISPRIAEERTWYQVYLTSSRPHTHRVHSAITDWLSGLGVFGLRSWEKRIPEKVFAQPAEAIALFLKHLWATDGCISLRKVHQRRTPIAYYATSSEILARDVQSLLLRLGISARLKLVPQPMKGRNQHHVIITGSGEIETFLSSVGAVGNRRQTILKEMIEWISDHEENTNRDIIPHLVWRDYVLPAMKDLSITTREMCSLLNTAYCGTSLYKQNVSRKRASRIAEVMKSNEIASLAESGIYWDRVVSIEPDGKEEVFDMTVPGHHNFVAADMFVHNSIEQDADLVGFIYREEVYKPDREDLKGLAKLIIAKQRNGPIGDVNLVFLKEFTKFENRTGDLDDSSE